MKVSHILTFLGVSSALAAPTATIDKGTPSQPESYGPEHSVSWKPFKRHVAGEPYPGEPEPYGPTQSVTRQPWKRHVEVEERNDEQQPDEPPKPYQSVSWVPFKRSVEEGVPEPEHYEVLTA